MLHGVNNMPRCGIYDILARLAMTKSLFLPQQRSERSSSIRSKNVSVTWWRLKTHQNIGRKLLEKIQIFTWAQELLCYIVATFRVCISPDRVQIASWVTFSKKNVGHWSIDWLQKVFNHCCTAWIKCQYGVFSIFLHDSDLQKSHFCSTNGPYGLQP